MKFLVTGASGFVGANLVREIASRGLKVVASTLGPPTQAAYDFLSESSPLVDWDLLDVRDRRQVESVVGETRVDAIIHGAAVTSVSGKVTVSDLLATNVMGTVNVLEAARSFRAQRVVFLSSGAVYGRQKPCPEVVGENHPLRGESPYGVSKIMGEQFCRAYAEEHNVPVAICRLGTLYGPMEIANPHRPRVSVPCQLVSLAQRKSTLKVFGTSRRRPFCYVGDAARSVIDLALSSTLPSDTFHVGAPERVALADLLDILSRLRPGLSVEVVENQHDADLAMMSEDERPVLDTTRLESLLGPLHGCSIEEGIESFMDWLRKSPSSEHGS